MTFFTKTRRTLLMGLASGVLQGLGGSLLLDAEARPNPLISPPIHWKPRMSLGMLFPLQVGLEGTAWKELWTIDLGFFALPFREKRLIDLINLEIGSQWSLGTQTPFFMALHLGYHRLRFQGSLTALKAEGVTLATDAFLKLNALFVAPRLGIRYSLSQQLFAETCLGLDLPFVSWGSLDFANQEKGTSSQKDPLLASNASRAMEKLAHLPWPHFTLFRLIGFF